jgi:hypothetical protein
MRDTTARFVPLALIVALPALPAGSQAPADPYTRNEPAAIARVGYERLGSMPFGTGHSSRDIDALLPREPLLWIETAHFRIGCALPDTEIGADPLRRSVQKELTELATLLPRIDPKVRSLDRWLRAHLVARRAERLYADVQSVLGCTDADFAAPLRDEAPAFGEGPYLGQRQKFTVLLLEHPASLADYTAAYHGQATTATKRFFDLPFGTAFFGAAASIDDARFGGDEVIAVQAAYHIAHNLYSSYLGSRHPLPAWLADGLAHVHARAVSGRVPVFGTTEDDVAPVPYAEWGQRWPGWLRAGHFEPLATFCARTAEEDSARFHLQSWALAEWLVAERRTELAAFLRELKRPFDVGARFPSGTELLQRQTGVLRAVFGVDAEGLEKLWRKSRLARRTGS